jgi:hypothetical protein
MRGAYKHTSKTSVKLGRRELGSTSLNTALIGPSFSAKTFSPDVLTGACLDVLHTRYQLLSAARNRKKLTVLSVDEMALRYPKPEAFDDDTTLDEEPPIQREPAQKAHVATNTLLRTHNEQKDGGGARARPANQPDESGSNGREPRGQAALESDIDRRSPRAGNAAKPAYQSQNLMMS